MVLLLSFSLVQNAFANIDNVATASGTYIGVPVVSGNSPVSIPVVLNAPTIELQKSSIFNDESGDGFAQVGETITYSFSVQNTGNVTLTNITLADTIVSVPGTIASLAPGAIDTTTFSATYTLLAADLLALQVTNSATVTATRPSGPNVSDVSDSQNPGDDTGASDDVTNTNFMVPIDAVVDDFTASPVNGVAGGSTPTVFSNDTLNGAPFADALVTLAITSDGGITGLGFTGTGTLTIPAGTPAATYTVTYEICETANLANCDTADVIVVVTAATINADNDDFSAAPVNGVSGGTTATVFTNDTLNGVPFSPLVVDPTITVDGGITGLVINADGTLTIPAATPAATYTVTYEICEDVNTSNCDTANVTIVVAPNPSVTGTVYFDLDGNGVFGGPDLNAGSGYIVELVNGGGTVIDTTTTNITGDYTLSALPGSYSLMFRKPNLTAIGVITGVTLTLGQIVIDQDQPIDPSGVVYNSVTRLPVAGVTVRITDAGGVALPSACLLDPTQQDQVTDAIGDYYFDIVPACAAVETEFRISLVTVPSGYTLGVSATLTPQPGPLDATTCPGDAVPGGSCQVSADATAPVLPTVVYYTAFLLITGDPDVVNNHIAIDPLASAASGLSKRALVTQVRRGERVPYVITANDTTLALARIVDIIPPGFDYVADSALVNGVALEPTIAGRNLTFDGLDVFPNAGGDITIELTLIATVAVTTGPHVNTAQLIDPATDIVVGTARATVTVLAEHVFDCGDIIGKVFDDRNRNGTQDEGEPGLAGVRLVTVKGVLITTDKHGRFHVTCADVPDADIGSNFILKLDTRTLPSGFKMTTANPRIVRLTAGKASKLNFGASIARMVRFDMTEEAFAAGSVKLKGQWLRAVDKVISVLEADKSTLRLTYIAKTKDKQLSAERMAAVEKLISERWAEQGGGYELPIETRVMGAK